jgi:SOS-response transcriptional repressor LexA
MTTYGAKGFTVEDQLARILGETGIRTQAELAEVLGVRRAAVTDAKRRGKVPADWLIRLAQKYNLNPNYVLSGLGPRKIDEATVGEPGGVYCQEELSYVPKVRAVPTLGAGGLLTDDAVETYYAFRRSWLAQKGSVTDMRLMAVAGDSMEPTLRDGDMVLIDQSQSEVIFGKIYVVGIDDDGIVVKRLEKKPGKLVLVSDNRDLYDPMEIELHEGASVRIVGRVIWMGREIR